MSAPPSVSAVCSGVTPDRPTVVDGRRPTMPFSSACERNVYLKLFGTRLPACPVATRNLMLSIPGPAERPVVRGRELREREERRAVAVRARALGVDCRRQHEPLLHRQEFFLREVGERAGDELRLRDARLNRRREVRDAREQALSAHRP